MWSRGGGDAPPGLESAWQGNKADSENGVVVLGTPLGSAAFVEAFAEERLKKEEKLLDELPKLGDLQCAWVLLSQSAVLRANHTVRILPPTCSQRYAERHDSAVWTTFCKVFGAGSLEKDKLAQDVATLPGRLGGLGLRAAVRTAPSAYWASWVSTLAVFAQKTPLFSAWVLRELNDRPSEVPCLSELVLCAAEVEAAGAVELPTWAEAAEGAAPPKLDDGLDAADFERGWQCYAASFTETFFLERVVRPSCDKTRLALLLSQSSGFASAWLRAVPTEAALTFSPLCFQVEVRRRLRWPLPLSGGQCSRSCATQLDDKETTLQLAT